MTAGFDAVTWSALVDAYDLVETGALLFDREGRLLHANAAAAAILGGPVADADALWAALGLAGDPPALTGDEAAERSIAAPPGAAGSTALRVTVSTAADGTGAPGLRVVRLLGDAPPRRTAFTDDGLDALTLGVLHALDDVVVIHAPDTRILWCNDAYLDMIARWFGERPDPARLPLEAFTAEPTQLAAALLRVRAAFAGDHAPFVEQYGTGAGATWVEARCGPVPGRGDVPTGALFFFRDVTARERAALERDAALADARRAAADAARANRAKSDFLGRMSHELRTPLNAILGFSQLLEAEAEGPAREQLGYIAEAGQHLLGLVNEVLDIARLEAGRLSISVEAVDARAAIAEALRFVRPLAAERGVALEAPAGEHPVWVAADPQRLRQVLLNLLGNAVKYGADGGRCAVGLEDDDGSVVLAVRDWGPGIAPQLLPRIFEPFDRLGRDDGATEGSGLGLAVARALTEAMGGGLGVASAPGHGTTFTVRLRRKAAPAQRLLEATPRSPPPAVSRAARGRMLYVEDNLPNLRLVQDVLRLRPGVELAVATDGRTGLELARRDPPDLLLLDLHLPGLHGTEILRALRATPSTAALPVAILTADADRESRRQVAALGVVAQLLKPLDVTRLLAIVDEVLAPSPRLRILVAEDHPAGRALARRVFEAAGHVVDVAEDGDAALAALGAGTYDLAVLDQEMPGRTGLEVARALRAGGGVPSLVVLLSAHDPSDLQTGGLVDHVFGKPLTRATAAAITALVPTAAPA